MIIMVTVKICIDCKIPFECSGLNLERSEKCSCIERTDCRCITCFNVYFHDKIMLNINKKDIFVDDFCESIKRCWEGIKKYNELYNNIVVVNRL